MSSRQIPFFNSSEEILPYIARHRWELSMSVITNLCTGAIDTAAVERSAIRAFLQSLPYLQPEELGPDMTEKECPICLNEYSIVFPNDTPTKLSCGHILGADCMYTWLISGQNTCPQCRHQVFTRPVPLGFFSHQHLQLLEVRSAARTFLSENSWDVDQSYYAFCCWANGDADDMNSMAYRRLALDAIGTIETLARNI